MDFAVVMIVGINIFHSYTDGHKKGTIHTMDLNRPCRLSKTRPKKMKTWHVLSNYCNGISLQSLQYTLQCCMSSCTLYDIISFVKQLSATWFGYSSVSSCVFNVGSTIQWCVLGRWVSLCLLLTEVEASMKDKKDEPVNPKVTQPKFDNYTDIRCSQSGALMHRQWAAWTAPHTSAEIFRRLGSSFLDAFTGQQVHSDQCGPNEAPAATNWTWLLLGQRHHEQEWEDSACWWAQVLTVPSS